MADLSQSLRPAERGRPFEKGLSGNPKGRPKGNRNRATVMAQALLDGEAEALIRKVVQLALEGDPACLRICLDRLVPRKKDSPIGFNLPEMGVVADIPKFFTSVAQTLRDGEITPSEAGTLIDMAGVFHKLLELVEIEARLSALEEKAKLRQA